MKSLILSFSCQSQEKKGKMLYKALQIETLKSVHKNGVQYTYKVSRNYNG